MSQVDSSKDIFTTEQEEELLWLGDCPHYSPVIVHPSPLRYPAPMKVLTSMRPRHKEPLEFSEFPISVEWDSPTDILFYHHQPSSSCSHIDMSENCSASMTLESFYFATVQRARPQKVDGKMESPRILHINVGDGTDDDVVEILPFTPVIPGNKKHWEDIIEEDGLVQEANVAYLNEEPTISPTSSARKRTPTLDACRHDSVSDDLIHQDSSQPFPRNWHDAPGWLNGERTIQDDRMDGMQVDKGTFGEKDTLQELVERTGRVAKKARTGV